MSSPLSRRRLLGQAARGALGVSLGATWAVRAADATGCAASIDRDGVMPFAGGQRQLDLDEDALRRLWAHVDGVRPVTPDGPPGDL